MNCPVCNKTMQIPNTSSQEELYYDCEHCHSNLLIKSGDCEVLNRSSSKPEATDFNEVESPSLPRENLSSKTINKNTASKNLDNEDSNPQDLIEDQEVVSAEQEINMESNNNMDKSMEPGQNQKSQESFLEDSKQTQGDSFVEEQEQQEPEGIPELSNFEAKKLEQEGHLIEEQGRQEQDLPEHSSQSQPGSNSESKDENSDLEDFSEVASYGNNGGLAQEGLFYYDLTLSEINSKQLRQEVESLLQDRGFQFDLEKNDLQIKNGVLKLTGISPVKVHILVKSLIGLRLKISWKQHLMIDKPTGQ